MSRSTLRTPVLAVMVVSTAAAAPTTSATVRPTTLHQYVAFENGRLAPNLVVRTSVRGFCWTTSIVAGRPYTWRCMHGDYIEDPCFSASPRSRRVVCPRAPWNSRVLEIRLTRPLPRWVAYPGGSSPRWPWGVGTTNGRRCLSLAGTANLLVAGREPTYACKPGGLLLELPRQTAPMWTIRYAAGWRSKTSRIVGLTDAWW